MRLTLFAALPLLLAACVQPRTAFEPATEVLTQESVMPGSVHVLYDAPHCACRYIELGIVSVESLTAKPTPSRVKALQQEAAIYGADAIIIHKTPDACMAFPGVAYVECPGRGRTVEATAIRYLSPEEERILEPEHDYIPAHEAKPMLEKHAAAGYDTHQSHITY